MPVIPLGVVLTAGALGVTHAIEPDHVAGVSSLTSRYGDSRLSALVGACFSLGHVALVVAWLVIGYALLGRTSFAPAFDVIGTVGVAVLLGLLGATMAVGGIRSVVHAHGHDHGDDTHEHLHLHLPSFGATGHDHDTGSHEHCSAARDQEPGENDRGHAETHDHDHGIGHYLKIGLVGALFTLSPPVSMIAFSATLFPAYGPDVVVVAVIVYAVAITTTMSALGAGVGAVFGVVDTTPWIHGVARSVAGLAIAFLSVSLFFDALPLVN